MINENNTCEILVTIIVPVYNAEQYLSECLNSLIIQTYKNIEIICINDGSKDKSSNILSEFSKIDKRINVYEQENKGVSATRNKGINLSNGEYIMFVDADDVCSENFVESSIKIALSTNSDIVINSLNIRKNQSSKKVEYFSYLSTWQIFVKKSFLNKNPVLRFNENLKMGEDAIFSHMLLALSNNVCKNTESKYKYRIYEMQASNKLENNLSVLMDNTKTWFDILDGFYTKYGLWTSKSEHFKNFIIEQPFTSYIRNNWDYKRRKELYNLIHNYILKLNLKNKNFEYNSMREKLFLVFVHSPFCFFEVFRFFVHLYYEIYKSYVKKNGEIK